MQEDFINTMMEKTHQRSQQGISKQFYLKVTAIQVGEGEEMSVLW